jgi:hypothetical protein
MAPVELERKIGLPLGLLIGIAITSLVNLVVILVISTFGFWWDAYIVGVILQPIFMTPVIIAVRYYKQRTVLIGLVIAMILVTFFYLRMSGFGRGLM